MLSSRLHSAVWRPRTRIVTDGRITRIERIGSRGWKSQPAAAPTIPASPTATATADRPSPSSSGNRRLNSSTRRSSGSRPSRLAKDFDSRANHTDWYPINTSPAHTASVPMLNVAGPTVTSVNVRTRPTHAAEQQQGEAGVEEQPAWAVQQQEAQVTPPVPPGAEMGWAGPTVPVQPGGHLGDAHTSEGGLHHHLAGELHAWRLEVEVDDRLTPEAPQSAVEVADVGVEEQPAEEGQRGVADVAVQRWHGAVVDAAGETVAHHQVGAPAQRGEERVER